MRFLLVLTSFALSTISAQAGFTHWSCHDIAGWANFDRSGIRFGFGIRPIVQLGLQMDASDVYSDDFDDAGLERPTKNYIRIKRLGQPAILFEEDKKLCSRDYFRMIFDQTIELHFVGKGNAPWKNGERGVSSDGKVLRRKFVCEHSAITSAGGGSCEPGSAEWIEFMNYFGDPLGEWNRAK